MEVEIGLKTQLKYQAQWYVGLGMGAAVGTLLVKTLIIWGKAGWL